MNEQDDILKSALAENAAFKAKRATAVRNESLSSFRNRLALAERIMWVYLLICVIVGVPTLNVFFRTYDTKTLISCVLLLLVVYETTVLLKLWYATAGTKLSVLKEVKQLRLEVSEMAAAAGVTVPADVLATKYEPMQGTSRLERKIWIVVLVLAAALAGSTSKGLLSGEEWSLGPSRLEDDTLVTLDADGSAVSTTTITRNFSSKLGASIPFFAPSTSEVRWFDADGNELSVDTSPQAEGERIRYDVQLPEDVDPTAPLVYARVAETPAAATLADGVWLLESDISYGVAENSFTLTVLLPAGAELVSAQPKPIAELSSAGRPEIHFQATRGRNEKFHYSLKYRLPAEAASNPDQER